MEHATPNVPKIRQLRNVPDDTAFLQNLLERLDRTLSNHMADLRGHLFEMEERLSGDMPLRKQMSKSSVAATMESDMLDGRDGGRPSLRRQGSAMRTPRHPPPPLVVPETERQRSANSATSSQKTLDSVIELGGDTRGDGSQSRSCDPSQVAGGPPTSTISGATFTLNGHWQEGVSKPEVAPMLSMVIRDLSEEELASVGRYQSHNSLEEAAPACMLRPSSSKRLAWDLLGVCFILYDVVTIPIFLAFNPKDTDFTVLMFWLVLSFWTLDIALSFSTGIYHEGVEEMRRSKVAISYMRTWFLLDVVVVGVDWFVFFMTNVQRQKGVSVARVSKTVRTIRIIRSLRLLRILKVKRLLEYIQDHITSEVVQIMLKLANLMLAVLLINHNVACIWYFLGDGIDGLVLEGWVKQGGFDEEDGIYSYVTALHWSLTQFTTGSMEIHAGTTAERVYSVIVLVFALMVFSFFLSSITASMTQLRNLTNAFDNKFSILRRYLKLNTVPNALSIRILRCVQHKLSGQSREIREADVQLLQVLSRPLQRELMQFINQPKLIRHPLFRTYGRVDKIAMQDLCSSALTVINLSVSDVLFTQRASDGQMYFCAKGELQYTPGRTPGLQPEVAPAPAPPSIPTIEDLSRGVSPTSKSSSSVPSKTWSSWSAFTQVIRGNKPSQDPSQLKPQDWCCEPALWTTWIHLGNMRSVTVTEVLSLGAADFAASVAANQHMFHSVISYAHKYLLHLNQLSSQNALSDLPNMEAYRHESMVEEAFVDMLQPRVSVRGDMASRLKSPRSAERSVANSPPAQSSLGTPQSSLQDALGSARSKLGRSDA